MTIIILALIMGSVRSISANPVVKTWTFNELSREVENYDIFVAFEDPEKKPLIDAFELIMSALFTGHEDSVLALMLSPTGSKCWTKDQLENGIIDPHTDPEIMPYLDQAYQILTQGEGVKKATTEVRIPALDISTWSSQDVLKALKDPQTKQALIPYLKDAKQEFEEAKANGEKKEKVSLVTPVGLIPPADGVIPTIVQRSSNEEDNNLVG